jgi:hypothetical protein
MNYEINKIVDELYTCLPNDRNKFNNIMENLKQQFLSTGNKAMNFKGFTNSQLINENLIDINNINNQNYKANSLNNVNNLINNSDSISSLNPLKGLNNLQPIVLPTLNIKNKKNDSLNNEDLGDAININNMNKDYQIGLYNENKYDNNIKHDVHANCKYYYPEEYNSQINDNNKYQNY